MEKTLTQLGLEYLDAAQKMDCLIRKCTKELKEATERRDYRACLLLKQKRLCFYSQKRDLMETAYKLQNYYNRKERNLIE